MINRLNALLAIVFVCLTLLPFSMNTIADERDAEAAMAAATGHSPDEENVRPAKMPDFTKGEVMPPAKKVGVRTLNLGPTGVIGIPNGWYDGDQIQVAGLVPGSPAEGILLPGDAILGVNGKDFKAGGHLGVELGNAIIKSEEEAGKGVLRFRIWRDRNYTKRGAPKDMLGVDIDELFAKANEPMLYEWKEEEERAASVKQMAFDEFPIDGFYSNVVLQLEVMGTYSDTSPWNCPVATKIRDNALKIVAKEFIPPENRRVRRRPSWPGVLALVASGKPEYLALAKKWVHSLDNFDGKPLCQDMTYEPTFDDLRYRGMQTWHHGFSALEMAIYYDATGDDYVLPEIRRRAILVALGQNGGGSWGHTFSFPEQNGGELHRNNPGYGAMNNSGTRCFFLMTLAKKFGVDHPEVNAAIERSAKFFGTYVDRGCIPYGYHPPWPSDDSNGKNYGAAYAFYTLGQRYEAKYFSMHSAHAAFSRRGGHGSATLWYYTPFSSFISGPRATMLAMRNMRWFYTLARRHDGSFVFQGKQAGINGENKGMRAATATHATYYCVPQQKLMITGKDADKSCWFDDEELEELLVSARGQFQDPALEKAAGVPAQERSTDDLILLLDHFFPNARAAYAKELGHRFVAGETSVVDKVVPLLGSSDARTRAGACLTLAACGNDSVLSNLSKLSPLLVDSAEFVRMVAVKTISDATEKSSPQKRNMMLLKAAVKEFDQSGMDNGNLLSVLQGELFPKLKRGETQPEMLTDPFAVGFDYDLVRGALENIVTMDPGGTVPASWTRDTVVKMAGPIVFVASELQVNDAMFGGARLAAGRAILAKYGYRERFEADYVNLLKRIRLERDMRENVGFKSSVLSLDLFKENPASYRAVLPSLCQWLQDNPLATVIKKEKFGVETMWVGDLVRLAKNARYAEEGPLLLDEVRAAFAQDLNAIQGSPGKVKHCRAILADPEKKDIFRKLAALETMRDLIGVDGLPDLFPYLGHAEMRLRDGAHRLAVTLVKQGGMDQLLGLIPSASSEQLAAMMLVLRDAGDRQASTTVRSLLKHRDGIVRKTALQALIALEGQKELSTIFSVLSASADPHDLWGCELALLSKPDDPGFCQQVREKAIALLPGSSVASRRSLAWVLGQLGGQDCLMALNVAAGKTEDETDLRNIVKAIAYSPDRNATQVMMALAEQGGIQLDAVAAQGVRRMVGPNGPDDVTDDERVALARAILNLKLDKRLVQFLGYVPTGKSIQLLFDVMKNSDLTSTAASSIISAAERFDNPPPKEAEIAADGLTQVIEYIEVTRLRGGMQAHMNKDDKYLFWKELQARAGKALLKVHKPKAAPIPTFDDMDLDF